MAASTSPSSSLSPSASRSPSASISPSPSITAGATIVDSYSELNIDNYFAFALHGFQGVGQAFTGDGSILDSVKLPIKKVNFPTGNSVVKIYAISGSFGNTAIPSGTALATSNNFPISSLPGYSPFTLVTFTFSGANRITLVNGTKYIITYEFTLSGDVGGYVLVGVDSSSPSHTGNISTLLSGSWASDNTTDMCFYIYGLTGVGNSRSASISPSSSRSPSASVSTSPSPSLSPSSSPSAGPPVVRVVYMYPSDVKYNPVYETALRNGIIALKDFYLTKLGIGKTFSLDNPIVRVVQTTHPTSYYATGIDGKIRADGTALVGAVANDPKAKWLLYLDADSLGQAVGTLSGIATFPQQDLVGITNETDTYRWIGGMGHELGHCFGMNHPDTYESPLVDSNALMMFGYQNYPNTYFTPASLGPLADLSVVQNNATAIPWFTTQGSSASPSSSLSASISPSSSTSPSSSRSPSASSSRSISPSSSTSPSSSLSASISPSISPSASVSPSVTQTILYTDYWNPHFGEISSESASISPSASLSPSASSSPSASASSSESASLSPSASSSSSNSASKSPSSSESSSISTSSSPSSSMSPSSSISASESSSLSPSASVSPSQDENQTWHNQFRNKLL